MDKYSLLGIALYCCFSLLGKSHPGLPPSLKVKLASHQRNFKFFAADLIEKSPLKQNKKSYKKEVWVDCSQTRYYRSTDAQPVWKEVYSPAGVVKWKGKYLAGKLQVLVSDSKKGRCHLINKLDMEGYISQVISREMHPNWPLEALKAQAVVARTYAYFKIKKRQDKQGYDLDNSELDQVMGMVTDKSVNTTKATRETRGEILLTLSGKLEEAFYHSKCGGQTLTPEDVWGGTHMEGYESVKCPFCHDHGLKDWERNYSKGYLEKLLSKNRYLSSEKKRATDQWVDFKGGRKYFKRTSLRRSIGRKKIPSHNYKIQDEGARVRVLGKGHGHGVGMCQFGAFAMAKKGLNYRQILKFYFPKMKLRKIY